MHPPPADVRARARRAASRLFMRCQLRAHPELRERIWPDYTFGCKRVLFSSLFLPALRAPNVEVVTEPIERLAPDGRRDRRRHARTRSTASSTRPASARPSSCSRWRSPAPAGARCARRGRRRARPPRDDGPRLPVAVRDVRAEHEHLGRLDHRLPRGAGRLHPPGDRAPARARRRAVACAGGRGGLRPRGAGALRRHGVDAAATPGTATRAAGSSPTGPATCASTSSAIRRLDPADFELVS